MEYFKLANGLGIPAVGSGTNTFAKTNGKYDGHTDEIVSCVRAGYRFFDTAESYGNEEAVGTGVIESGVGRENIFIATKMRTRITGQDAAPSWKPADAVAAVERSLKKLKTDYIDLYMIHMHWDNDAEMAEIWKVFEEYYEKGVLRSIGVSNFSIENLQYLMGHCRVRPMVDQVRISPGFPNAEVVDFCRANGILPMAWGPLRAEGDTSSLSAVGKKYGKSWAQVVLRRNFQLGIVSIPKAHSFEHQKANLDIFDFALTDEELLAF